MKLEIYSKDWCPYCAKAKALFRSEGISYEERLDGGMIDLWTRRPSDARSRPVSC